MTKPAKSWKELGDKTNQLSGKRRKVRMPSVRLERLARAGNKLIIIFGYMDPTTKLQEKFPDVKFNMQPAIRQQKNVSAHIMRAL